MNNRNTARNEQVYLNNPLGSEIILWTGLFVVTGEWIITNLNKGWKLKPKNITFLGNG